MSEAAKKRRKDGLTRCFNLMNRETLQLRERFYASTISFHTQLLQDRLDLLQDKLENATDSYQKSGLPQSIRRVEDTLSRKYANQLEWISEAKANFDAKLQKVASRLVDFDLHRGVMSVEQTWIESSREMSFVISSEIRGYKEPNQYLGSAHARLIEVDGPEKCFHYRFICTLKDKPGTSTNPTKEVKEANSKVTVKQCTSRLEQVKAIREQNPTIGVSEIAKTLDMNISYVRTMLRKLRA